MEPLSCVIPPDIREWMVLVEGIDAAALRQRFSLPVQEAR